MSTVNFKAIILMALSIGLSQNLMVADGCETVKQPENFLYPEQLALLLYIDESGIEYKNISAVPFIVIKGNQEKPKDFAKFTNLDCSIESKNNACRNRMPKLKFLPSFTEQLSNSFDNLIDDPYLKSTFKFRRRSYSTGKIISNIFAWDECISAFLQGTTINNYLGGISREYIPIDPNIKEDLFQQVIINAYNQLPLADYDVGVHQMRTVANTNNQGFPTPEGIHQDGFDYVTITCVNLKNVSGGITILFDSQDHTKIAFEGMLHPGMQLVFCDRTLSHFTSNISPKIPGDAYRDVIVTTFLNRQKQELGAL